MYKAIIFDFFGVFCPDATLEWFRKTVPHHEAKLAQLQAICTKSDLGQLAKPQLYKELSRLTDIPINEVVEGIEGLFAINVPLVTYVEGLRHKGYKTACLSNCTSEILLDVMSKQELGEVFDHVVLSADLGMVKPDVRIYQYVLKKLHVKAAQALLVDDRQPNIDAAETCGIRGLLFTDTPRFVHDFEALTASK